MSASLIAAHEPRKKGSFINMDSTVSLFTHTHTRSRDFSSSLSVCTFPRCQLTATKAEKKFNNFHAIKLCTFYPSIRAHSCLKANLSELGLMQKQAEEGRTEKCLA